MGKRRRFGAVFGALSMLVALLATVASTPTSATVVGLDDPDLDWVGGYHEPMSLDWHFDFMMNSCDGEQNSRPYNGVDVDNYDYLDANGNNVHQFSYHLALDMNRGGQGDDANLPVYAIADGVVLDEQPDAGWPGGAVWITHSNGGNTTFTALYGHVDLAIADANPDTPEKDVVRGQQIGTIHDYSASHLHFGINTGSTTASGVFSCNDWTEADPPLNGWVDPAPWLAANPIEDDPDPEPDPSVEVSTVLILDSSGSMGTNDPAVPANDGGNRGLRLQAAVRYVTNTLPGDEVAAVEFDSSARTLSNPVAVGEFGSQARTDLSDLIKPINSSGGTDLEDGLQAGCDALALATKQTRAAIFFTDGNGTYTGAATQCYVDAGWSVYTMGLGSGVDEDVLQLIADETGGSYRQLTIDDLDVCAILALRAEIAGGGVADPCTEDGVIEQDEVVNFPYAVVENLRQISFVNTWPGSDIEMTATSPSGRSFDRSTVADDLLVDVGPTFEVLTITDPEAGNWDIQLVGTDIPDGPEPYSFTPVEIPGDPDPVGPATIGGSITNTDDGSALADVVIDLYSQDINGARDTYLSSTTTAADGSYSFSVDAGCYVVTVIAPPNGVFPQRGTFLNLDTCVEADEVDESLDAGITIVVEGSSGIGGTIDFTDGSGAVDVVVDLFVAADEWNRAEYLGSSRTVADGTYVFEDIQDGCYIVVMIAPKGAEFEGGVAGDESRLRWRQAYGCVDAEQNNVTLNGTLVAEPNDLASSIGGNVTNEAGAPEADIVADIYTAGGVGDRAQWIESTKTDIDGNFLFTGRLADCYIVVLTAPQGRTFVDNGAQWRELFSCVDPGEVDTSLSAVLTG